jgi:3,4-dihydroxy 2-butanone 4-phosphate synthase / GTP cyclohydrolase II
MIENNKKMELILEDVRKGKPIVVVDSLDRENEGDVVLAAENITKHNLLFAMRHAKGLMCLPCGGNKLDQFGLAMMPTNEQDQFGTPFVNSIDAVLGCTTGMSVEDRLKTIRMFVSDSGQKGDLATPGHLFPLRGRKGLLKERAGHTESSLSLMLLAGLKPLAVIVEIMDDNGQMLKGGNLMDFCKIYNLNIISIPEIEEYCAKNNIWPTL